MRRERVPVVVYRNFMLVLLGIAVLLIGGGGGVYLWETRALITRVKILERHNSDLQKVMVTRNMSVIYADILFLARQNELIQLLETHDAIYRKMITEEYVEFSRQRGIYDQVRFINAEGMEVCRVDYHEGHPSVVAESALQSKGDRYYVASSLALNRQEIFVSPMDLNIEHGEIEVPLKPMIRFGTPVFDRAGEKRGAVILNYLGTNLLCELEDMSRLSRGQIFLMNDDGYWLKGIDPDDEWGFMYEDRRDRTFQSVFPDVWTTISAIGQHQVMADEGLFTAITFQIPAAERHGHGFAAGQGGILHSEPYHWTLVSFVPMADLNRENRGLLLSLFGMALFLFCVSILPAFWLVQARHRQAMDHNSLIRMANFDALTGLANRFLSLNRMTHTLKRAKRYKTSCALLFIDLDGFKGVNDTLGHEAGDVVLKETASRLTGMVRESDLVGRHGGDEFTVLLPVVETPGDAETVAEKIVAAFSEPFAVDGQEMRLGVSIGIALFPDGGESVDALLHAADAAMYAAKSGGKNRWVTYAPPHKG